MGETEEITDAWVTVSSFCQPCRPEPDFEALVAAELERWTGIAREAGLAPEANIRLARGEDEVAVEVSPALDAYFTPVQTLWKAE
ncbi:MAG: hypothetical protein ACP59X_11325 [Solidesulfovibrio sp. DCME]|uniref:hypothetical protein n=1 Tax=Solidesulfovibrio sp. DCME TaxID=3447380 RepID=UPI003D13C71F